MRDMREREDINGWTGQKVPWPTTEVHPQGSSHMVLGTLSPAKKHGKGVREMSKVSTTPPA
jgi:hypothetical protein